MPSLTRWVLAHKWTVVVTWIALTIAGIAASGPAVDALEPEFSVPDKEGWETNQLIAERYAGTGGDAAPLLPVVTLPDGASIDSEEIQADLAAIDERLAEALPSSRVASYASTGDEASSPTMRQQPSRSSTRPPIPSRSSERTLLPRRQQARRSRARRWAALPFTSRASTLFMRTRARMPTARAF